MLLRRATSGQILVRRHPSHRQPERPAQRTYPRFVPWPRFSARKRAAPARRFVGPTRLRSSIRRDQITSEFELARIRSTTLITIHADLASIRGGCRWKYPCRPLGRIVSAASPRASLNRFIRPSFCRHGNGLAVKNADTGCPALAESVGWHIDIHRPSHPVTIASRYQTE